MARKNAKAKASRTKAKKTTQDRVVDLAAELRRDLLLQVAVDGLEHEAAGKIVDRAVTNLTDYWLMNAPTSIDYSDRPLDAVEIAVPATEYERTMEALKAAADIILQDTDKLAVRVCLDAGTVVHKNIDLIEKIGRLANEKEATS